MATQISSDITFLVLCGGDATRMVGLDKPLQAWRGVAMVDRVVASVPTEMPVLISANRNLEAYAQRGSVFCDAQILEDIRSPLVGILGGLRNMHTQWLLVAPGDTPNLSSDWWQPLLAAGHHKALARVIFDGVRQQNLHLLLHRELAENLEDYLRSGQHQVYQWLAQVDAKHALAADATQYRNINTIQDLTAQDRQAD